MVKTTITKLPIDYNTDYRMTIISRYRDTMIISIDEERFCISIPKNISWYDISVYAGMVCIVQKESYYSGRKKYAKLELIEVCHDNYYEKENNYKKTSTYSSDTKYYEVLQCDIDSSFDKIKKNYRTLIRQYHYDTLASKDLPKDILDFAEQRSKNINEAYEVLKRLNT